MTGADNTLLLVILMVTGVCAAAWAAIVYSMRLAGEAAGRMLLANLLFAAGAVLVARRGVESDFLYFHFADWLLIGGFTLLREAIAHLAQEGVPTPARRWAPLAIQVVLTVAVSPSPDTFGMRTAVFSLVAAWLCTGICIEMIRGLGDSRIGLGARLSASLPFILAGAVLYYRGLDSLAGLLNERPVSGAGSAGFLWMLLLLLTVANVAIAGLAVTRLVLRVGDLAELDYLTGCLNRRAFESRLVIEMERSRRSGDPLACIMFDLDHFKRINDEHGHEAGDAALRHSVTLARAALRSADVIGRFGGEEFVVLMPGADEAGAREAAERIRKSLHDFHFEFLGRQISVCASFGVAMFGGGESRDALLRRVDAAMYEAKRLGRDRTECAGEAVHPEGA